MMIQKPRYFNFYSIFLLCLWVLAVLIIVAPQFPTLSLVSDYTIHFMVFFFLIGIGGYFFNNRKIILSSFGICALLCVILKNESESPFINKDEHSDQVLFAHINLANVRNPFELLPTLIEMDCDVLSFVEVTPDWEDILESGLALKYKYSTDIVRIDPFGKAVFSKYPLSNVDTIKFEEMTDLSAEINIDGKIYKLYNTYIIPPLDNNSQVLAKKQLEQLTSKVSGNVNSIVLGEYNMVYWSSLIKSFRFNTNLQSSRRDIIPSSLDVPRDHIFHSNEMQCLGIKDIHLKDGSRVGLFAKYRIKSQRTGKDNDSPKLSKLE
ncbi:MAG: endonuclease/exonuclease/phosphatase family protein [Saprospiraceae bacterium]|nr:endonuclease/exonuclease/phosphatase family protein [Saprospiraceae bacterium]